MNHRQTLLIFVALWIFNAVPGQVFAATTEAWVRRYNGPANNNDFGQAVAMDGSGNVVVTGYSRNGSGNDDYYTAKYAAVDGMLLWEKRYNGPGNSNDQAQAVAVDSSGNVVVTGYSHNGSGNNDYYTAKYGAVDGALLWEKRYNGPVNDFDEARAVVVDGSGNVVVTGYSYGTNFNADYYTAKYAAADGALLWERRYNGPANSFDYAMAVAVDASGNVVVTGYSASGLFWPWGSGRDYYTVKYAATDGALLWEKRDFAVPSGVGVTRAMVVDGSGNVVVTGYSNRGTHPHYYYTAKYALTNGALLWQKLYDGPGDRNVASALAVDASGNVFVSGDSSNGTNSDYYTAKYAAADGALLWEKRYNGPATGNDQARSVAVDGSGNVVVTGCSRNASGNDDYYTAKYAAADGALLWEKRYNGPANGNDLVSGNDSVFVSPSRSLALGPNGMVAVTGYSDGDSSFSTNNDYATVVYREELPLVSIAVENVLFTPVSLSVGQSLNVSFRVRNVSTNSTPPFSARIRLSEDAVLSDNDPGVVPLAVNVPALPPGALSNLSTVVTAPAGILPGTYYVCVWADPDHFLNQTSRANNIALSASKLTVFGTGGPSLLVTPTTQTINSDSGGTSVTIRNAGGGTLTWSAAIVGAPWMHFASDASGVAAPNGSTLIVFCDPNSSTSPRTGTIAVNAPGANPASQEVTVMQAGAPGLAPIVTSFEFSTIPSPQTVLAAFPLTITAMDATVQPSQVQTAFNGRVGLRYQAGGSINPQYVELRNGTWSGSVSLNTASAETVITASRSPETISKGESNPFAVEAAGSVVKATIFVQTTAGAVINGASVTLQQGRGTLMSAFTDNGRAEFTVPGAGRCYVTIQKDGFSSGTDGFRLEGFPIVRTVKLRVPGKPPVILVPGMLGSCDDVGLDLLPYPYPLLPSYRAAPEDLKLFNPRVLGLDFPGWNILSDLLDAHYEVFEAPWDWRVPVIGASGEKAAWEQFLQPVIDKAKEQTGHSKVDIVAHSMGGILTRAYIESLGYRGDIGKFAMVGTPNEGSAKAYYMWFGGDPSIEGLYERTSKHNYERWNVPKEWDAASQSERQSFYRTQIPALEELLPVYSRCLSYVDSAPFPYPGHTANQLYQLNEGDLGQYDIACEMLKVCAKVFYSESELTIAQIRLQAPTAHSSSSVYPHGKPKGDHLTKLGDGTVVGSSAMLNSRSTPFNSSRTFVYSPLGTHGRLIAELADEIMVFLDEGKTFPAFKRAAGAVSLTSSPSNQFVISVHGRCQVWVLDPQLAGAGISPVSGSFSNSWAQGTVEAGAQSCTFERSDAPAGFYHGSIKGFIGETLSLGVQLFQTNRLTLTNVNWIVSTNNITFDVQLQPEASNALNLLAAISAPENVRSFSSNGVCNLSWNLSGGTNAAAYRIYARRDDESLFQPLGTTTNLNYDTGRQWNQGPNGTNWYFAVVAVTTNNAESPYMDIVRNDSPMLANFSANIVRGTPPLAVTFTDQSSGGVTNWTWDFDSDGTIDSTDTNPTIVYAEPGSYTVSLTVSGPNGEDTRVAVGIIEVFLPLLKGITMLPDRTVQFDLSAQAGRNYLIQASQNLTAWATLTNLTSENATTTFRDTSATNFTQQFYRAITP